MEIKITSFGALNSLYLFLSFLQDFVKEKDGQFLPPSLIEIDCVLWSGSGITEVSYLHLLAQCTKNNIAQKY